ncbi:hypothetical protein [Chryseosolibacter indicus]|uniref:DUF304 domain-containing protein n=1 Tax=Chryseosolibacter indicus TaxID=2782351 RepID=A0ABS5VUP0_9BACT|nr:hypothetical protein [Chryseosolibacter indicus]MBT1705147.1 hypothetical protein [Chryseosolibacter indicus]
MIESKLNRSDEKRIFDGIKLTLFFGFVVIIVSVLLIGLIPLLAHIFGREPSDGFLKRGLFILSLVLLFYLVVTWRNLIKFIDLNFGRKLTFTTSDYKIEKGKAGVILITISPLKLKLDLYDDLQTLIKQNEPITIEVSKFSKALLFISHGTENLLQNGKRK